MYYGTIKKYDIANGPGVRVSLFVSGCRHHCKGCFNAETWDSDMDSYIQKRRRRDFSGIGAGIYTGLYAARRRTV